MSTPTGNPTVPPGRRTAPAGRRLDVTVVLAVVLPLVCAGLLLLAAPATSPRSAETGPPGAPAPAELTRTTVVCPSGGTERLLGRTEAAGSGNGPGIGSGEVTARSGDDERSVTLEPGVVARLGGGAFTVLGAEGSLASGLVAGAFGEASGTTCTTPRSDQWFTGVGAGARHLSTLELVNPDGGPALVDVVVYGREGVVPAPGLRGLAVGPSSRTRVDLATTVPRRDDLALRVTTVRGRVGAFVLDSFDRLGSSAVSSDWLPGQAEPATESVLLGPLPAAGQRMLVLGNPGESEIRASVQVLTGDSTFVPEGAEDVVVAPESVSRTSLRRLLRDVDLDDALGLVVTASAPATASLRTFVDGDLTHRAPAEPVGGAAALPVPADSGGRLLLGPADAEGTVTVLARDAVGEQVAAESLEVAPGRGAALDLPPAARLVSVVPDGVALPVSLLLTEGGTALLPLVEPPTSTLVSQVRPGLR